MKIKRHDLKGFFPSQTRCDRFSIVFSSEMARVLLPSAAPDVFECICMYVFVCILLMFQLLNMGR